MRALKIAGMVVGAPLAYLGFLLPAQGILAGLGLVASEFGQSHGFIIIVGR